ncbi:MAG: type II CAAX endopeptidase family protein [Planctomycetota bacterium]|nr:type II CAAX endopeptidase family protein [Planctomycetota bacterium]
MIAAARSGDWLTIYSAWAGVPVLLAVVVLCAVGRFFQRDRSQALPPRSVGEGVRVAVLMFMGVLLVGAVQGAVLASHGLSIRDPRAIAALMMVQAPASLAAAGLGWWYYWRRLARPCAPAYRLALQGVVVLGALLPVCYGLAWLLTQMSAPQPDQSAVTMVVEREEGWWAVLPMAVLTAPLLEETVFRGALYGGLRVRLGFWPAAAISSALFGAVHGWGAALPLAALGMGLCWLVERTGSLVPGVVAHALFNAITITSILTA